ncbi:hypothetical protein Mapa_008167 [Marchantia paleacea]|nr:hypothetical protein Mapa_008167 [Marchantia paleacea]
MRNHRQEYNAKERNRPGSDRISRWDSFVMTILNSSTTSGQHLMFQGYSRLQDSSHVQLLVCNGCNDEHMLIL